MSRIYGQEYIDAMQDAQREFDTFFAAKRKPKKLSETEKRARALARRDARDAKFLADDE